MVDVEEEPTFRALATELVASWEISDEICRRVALIMTDDLSEAGSKRERRGRTLAKK